MKWMFGVLIGVALVGTVPGCKVVPPGSLGGTCDSINFAQGFVFIRSEDRNLYLADKSEYSTVAKITHNGNNRHPAFSSDSRLAAFIHLEGGNTELWTTATSAGCKPTVVLASDTIRRNFRFPVFSPDGTKIVFVFDKGAGSGIGKVNADGSGFVEVTSGPLSYGSPSFLPDGQTVIAPAGSSSSMLNQIEQIDLNTASSLSIRSSLGNEALQIADRAVVSPNGKLLAFDARTSPNATRVFVMDLATKNVIQISDHTGEAAANDAFPTWTSNTELAFQSDAGGGDQVYVVPASGPSGAGTLSLPTATEPWFGPVR